LAQWELWIINKDLMKTQFESLFNPLKLNSKTLKNRYVVAPMTRTSATADGIPTDEMVTYYECFARGGFGMIVTEGTYTDDQFSRTNFYQPGLVNEAQLKGWQNVVNAVKKHGSIVICQLMHAGALSQYHQQTIAPSAIQPVGQKMPEAGGGDGLYPLPSAASAEDLAAIKIGFVNAARYAKEAGFDGVEIHAANGYLFDQFITEYTNKRKDKYGGVMENRVRILAEVFTAIRLLTGNDFIIGIRFSEGKVNNLSYRWKGGVETAKELFKEVAKMRPDYIHIAAEGGQWARECAYPDGSSSNSIAREITGATVIANGGLHNTDLALNLLSDNHAHLVAIGRAAIANPDLPQLIKTERQIRPFNNSMIKPSVSLSNTKAYLREGHLS